MEIHQFAAHYQPEEDRILLRAASAEGEEVALWLTRRLMDRLWPRWVALNAEALLQHDARAALADASVPLRQMLADFRKAELLQAADFDTPYRATAASHALWPRPLLVTHVELRRGVQGRLLLRFSENFDQGSEPVSFQMNLDRQAAQGVLHLLERALAESCWAPPASLPAASGLGQGEDLGEDGSDTPPAARPRYVN